MTLPYVVETVTDGALGAVAGNADNTLLIMGACSLGTPGMLYAFTDPEDVLATVGTGPAPQQCANVLARGGGKVTALVCPITTTAGTIGTVVKVGTGAMTIADNSSAPLDSIDVVIKVTLGGAIATSTYQYSLDGGRTYNGADIVTAATITLPGTGIALTLTGIAVAGDTYSFSSTAPAFSTSAFNTAMDAALLTTATWSILHVVGTPADAAGCAALFAAVDTKVQAAVAAHRPFRAFIEGPSGVSDAAMATAFASISSAQGRVGVIADFAPLTSALTARTERRPAAFGVVARLISSPVEEDAGWNARGPLSGIGKLTSDSTDLPVAWGYHDERRTPGLDAARFCVLWSQLGLVGTYCLQGTMMAPIGSDFSLIQYGRVMDKALVIGHAAMLQYQGQALRVGADGTIDDRDAAHIEQNVLATLRSQLGASVSDVSFVVNRTDNILSTKVLRYRVRIRPLGYAKFITGEYGFINPALAA